MKARLLRVGTLITREAPQWQRVVHDGNVRVHRTNLRQVRPGLPALEFGELSDYLRGHAVGGLKVLFIGEVAEPIAAAVSFSGNE